VNFKELGKEIATLRKMKKISQKELCEHLHISRSTLSSFENGNGVDVGLKKVLQIIDYLGFQFTLKEKTQFPVFEDILNER
jgi:transcriptional regulator with XRE-family HTH domain